MTPSTLNFGVDAIGSTNSQNVTLKNTGNSNVTVSAIQVSDAQLLTSGSVSGATIAPGQTATLGVNYDPAKTGVFNGAVTLTSNASNSPAKLAVAATAQAASSTYRVGLSWKASPSTGVLGYFIYRSPTASGGLVRMNGSYTNALSFTDDTVVPGGTYYYSVTAIDTQGIESLHSNQAGVTVP